MNEYKDDTIKNEKLPILLKLLEEGQVIKIAPHGNSMFPFFLGDRDYLYISSRRQGLKRGDIALYRRVDGTYVVHRVHHVEHDENTVGYYMLGDHQIWIEGPLAENQIYGVVEYFERRGRRIDCEKSRVYHLAWDLWMRIRLLRPVICTMWDVCWKMRDKVRRKQTE